MDDLAGDWQIWLAIAVGTVATLVPRLSGVALSGRIDPRGAVFRWVSCLAYALMAGLIARMILFPVGPLLATELVHRLAATGLGLAVFFATRGNLALGVGSGTALLIALTMGALRFL